MNQVTILRLWHAVFAGGYLVAYLTGDEDTYAMHMFAGYVVLAALAVRLIIAVFARPGSLLALPRPSLSASLAGLGRRRGRNPLFGWFAAALLVVVGGAAATGAVAHFTTLLEDPHEAIAEVSLALIFAHIAFVAFMYGGKRLLARLTGAGAVAMAVLSLSLAPAHAADARQSLLDGFAAQARSADPSFSGFSARRGEAVYRTRWAGGDERTPACASCHGDDPRNSGRNAKTGRPIDPVAVSANPKRFTDPAEVEKHFRRDCKSVMGRACTPLEMGDYMTFLMER